MARIRQATWACTLWAFRFNVGRTIHFLLQFSAHEGVRKKQTLHRCASASLRLLSITILFQYANTARRAIQALDGGVSALRLCSGLVQYIHR
jgi:hypothetical protein